MRTRILALGLLAVAACGGGAEDGDATPGSPVGAPSTIEAAGAAPATTEPATTPVPTASEPTTTAPTEPAEVDGENGLLPISLPAIEALPGDVGAEGAGRPTFAWEAVDGAVEYLVVVHLDGQPDWGVTTTDTTATVGGANLHPDATGPRVTNDSVWYVVASDAEGTPLAQSAAEPVQSSLG